MQAVERLGSYISRGVYTVSGPFHPFGGAVDIVVVQQQDGSFKSSPWYVRFGKFQGVLKAKEKVVNISVNGVEADFHMYLDHKGEAFFLREVDAEEVESTMYPSSSGDETDDRPRENMGSLKCKSCNFDSGRSNSVAQIDINNGEIVARTNSRRSRILGLVFGRRSMKENNNFQGEVEGPGINRTDSLERAEIAANLLEVKWSTSLAFSKSPRKDSKKAQERTSQCNNMENGLSQRKLNEVACSCSEQKGISSKSEFDVPIGEEEGVNLSCLSTPDEVVDIAENAEHDRNVKKVISDSTGSDLQVACLEFEARLEKQLSGEVVSGGSTLDYRISEEADGVQSLVYCKTSESSMLGIDCPSEKTHEVLYVASGGCAQVHVHAGVLHTRTVMPPEVTKTEEATKDIDLRMPVMETSETHCQHTDCSHSVENPQTLPQPETVNLGQGLCSVQKVESNCVATTSYQASDKNNTIEKNFLNTLSSPLESVCDCVYRKPTSSPSSVSSEEEHFLFSDLDECRINDQYEGSISPDYLNKEDHLSNMNSTEKVNQLVDANQNMNLSPKNSTTENQITDLENLGVTSGPIVIPRNMVAREEVGQQTGSLPNMSLQSNRLGQHDVCYPLSHSLDSKSKSLKWSISGKDDRECPKPDQDKEIQLLHKEPGAKDKQSSGEINSTVMNAPIEISLCKHLSYEGMGADTASKAFYAEKLDIDKFTFLGPEIVRDNRLVVKIGQHYFPWDAAASIVLGMVSFGSQHIFDPKGMIPVDQVEKNHTGDPLTLSPSPGGNWRLWPFTFRRSKSNKAVLPAPSDAKNATSGNDSEGRNRTDADKDELKPNLMKKRVRENMPSSKQLASLNLKEGRNIVTFTFSTAMLGKQQIDARIYLWKWNTRIVISDVDGTITKSDVLGQFMPLVGMDWSQTGVAHLFSAIKENGYQLLFLSARAISQAYHTRQFLFNLKQNGKALPDGPVVISPDGLFPSLYREVIRRAPHEFKIACLEDIRALFPSDCNPFYAGFGNRDTDEISYFKVGIPKGKIFIINPKGEVAVNRRLDTKSYTSLHALVNGMFPPTNSFEQEDFNSWNYWKLPPPAVDF